MTEAEYYFDMSEISNRITASCDQAYKAGFMANNNKLNNAINEVQNHIDNGHKELSSTYVLKILNNMCQTQNISGNYSDN
jgi:hypothetical protein